MEWLTAAAVSFIYIFLKAIQQLNVVHFQYRWVMPASLAMGVCEATVIVLIVKADSILMGLVTGVGAGLGAMSAMRLHRYLVRS